MSEFDFLEPIPKTVMTVDLPSRGVPYPDASPQKAGKLTLSPMTMIEENMVLNQNNVKKQGDVIDNVISRCLQERIDLNTLLGADKFFLFMMLRAITYGPEYTFNWTCPAPEGRGVCNTKNTRTVLIPDDFMVKKLADEDTEPFKVTLPHCQKEIAFRLLRGFDEPEIEKHEEKIKEQQKQGIIVPDTTPAYRLARHVVAVDGKDVQDAPIDLLVKFIASLDAKDGQELRSKINYFTPGIETGVTLVCSECGTRHEWVLPITADFFRSGTTDEKNSMGDEVRSNVLPGVGVQRGDAH